jgi:hypothetical protein
MKIIFRRFFSIVGLIVTVALITGCALTPFGRNAISEGDKVKLSSVIHEAKLAIDDYQNTKRLAGGDGERSLLPLKSAEFTFKTEVSASAGGDVELYVFALGASVERRLVNEMTFTYTVPPPSPLPRVMSVLGAARKDVRQDLTDAIAALARAVQGEGTMGPLQYSGLTINLSYGVTTAASGGVKVPFQFVTAGVNAKGSRNAVQTIKLTFGRH